MQSIDNEAEVVNSSSIRSLQKTKIIQQSPILFLQFTASSIRMLFIQLSLQYYQINDQSNLLISQPNQSKTIFPSPSSLSLKLIFLYQNTFSPTSNPSLLNQWEILTHLQEGFKNSFHFCISVNRQIQNPQPFPRFTHSPMIKQLSQQTAEQLCAQQVITSLPDCIKELIDNSIDAGSTYIKIILHEYGKQKVEVIDNGFGIDNFDFLGKKGSTSKNKGNDQFNYLGFRGEAVHSIGRVSAGMTIESKCSIDGFRRVFNVNSLDLQIFKEERLCHGEFNFQVTNKQNSRNTGTKVTIDGIFKNLPVRHIELQSKYKQFLKRTNEVIKEFCLIYPEIQFIFINNRQGKQEIIIQTTSHKVFSRTTWLERIRQLDDRIGNSLIYIQSPFFQGYVLSKIESGSSRENNFIKRNYHYLFINRRPIDIIGVIQSTLNDIYKKYNNNTKYAFLINLKLDHNKIDVNLTPNKREIFIRKEILEKILAQLKLQIVEKVVEEIPTLGGFEDKRRSSQNQQIYSSQPSLHEHFSQRTSQPERKTICFPVQRTQYANDQEANKSEANNARTSEKFSTYRENFPGARNSTNQQIFNPDPAETKKELIINKPKKNLSELPELQKVNVDMSKLKEKLNNRLSINLGIRKTTAAPTSSETPLLIKQPSQPVNPSELSDIRKENQERKVREEQEDAKRRAEFLKEVKIEYHDEQLKKPKAVIEKSALATSHSKNQAKDNLMEQDLKRRNFQDVDESVYQLPTQPHQQRQDDDQIEEISSFTSKPVQPSDKNLENRIKAKINIDMSQIFVKFNSKNRPSDPKSQSSMQKQVNIQDIEENPSPPQHKSNSDNAIIQEIEILPESPQRPLTEPVQQAIMIDGKGNLASKSIKKQNFRNFEVIGQFNLGFILCIFNHEYFLVDQHAASQKYHYQHFLHRSHRLESIKSQQKQEITGIQADQIEDAKILLTEAGFYYNIIGRQLLELDRCPVFFESKLGLEYFWQIVEQKKELQRINKFTAMCAMKACKTAVVVGNPLRYGEMRQIVKNLADLESPWNCPHGRPTLVQLGKRITFRNKVTLPRTMKRYDF